MEQKRLILYMVTSVTEDNNSTIEYITFFIKEKIYAFPSRYFQGIAGNPNIIETSSKLDFALGTFHLSKMNVPVIDLNVFLGNTPSKYSIKNSIGIIGFTNKKKEQLLGFIVDSMFSMHSFPPKELKKVPTTSPFIKGIIEEQNEKIIIVDLEKILNDKKVKDFLDHYEMHLKSKETACQKTDIGEMSVDSSNVVVEKVSSHSFLGFYLKGKTYAFPILKVNEVIVLPEIVPMPKTPEYMKGVMNLRNQIIPIIDLGSALGMPEIEYSQETCVIIVKLQLGSSEKLLGFIVDSVSEVFEIKESEIDPPPTYGGSENNEFIKGIGKLKDRIAMLLDIDKILSKSDENSFLSCDLEGFIMEQREEEEFLWIGSKI